MSRKKSPNRRQFPGPPPSLSSDSFGSPPFSPCFSSSSTWSSPFGPKHGLSLSLADLFLSDPSENGKFLRRRHSRLSPSSSPASSTSPLDSFSLRRRASTLAAALGLASPRQFSNSSSSSDSILSESEVGRRLLAVGGNALGQKGAMEGSKERGRSVGIGIGTEQRGERGGIGSGLERKGDGIGANKQRGKGTFGGALVRHYPANRLFPRHSHPMPNPKSHPFRALLAQNARSLPALFGVAIDFDRAKGILLPSKHPTGHEGGGQLVRKRSFSRKSMLVPDRVPAGRRRSSAVAPRKTRPNLQAKIVASKKAMQMQRRQQQGEGGKQQQNQQGRKQQIHRGPSKGANAAAPLPEMPTKMLPQKPAKPGINVDWTHVPRLKLKFLGGKKKGAKEKKEAAPKGKKVAIKNGEEEGEMVPGGKNGDGKKGPKGIIQRHSLALENGKNGKEAEKQIVGGKEEEKLAKMKGKGNRRKSTLVSSRRATAVWRPMEPLIQPLDRTKMGKSRALKPIVTPKSPPSKGARIPPMNKQFLTGKAPDLFSRPVFLDSPKLMRNFGGARLRN